MIYPIPVPFTNGEYCDYFFRSFDVRLPNEKPIHPPRALKPLHSNSICLVSRPRLLQQKAFSNLVPVTFPSPNFVGPVVAISFWRPELICRGMPEQNCVVAQPNRNFCCWQSSEGFALCSSKITKRKVLKIKIIKYKIRYVKATSV